MCEWGDIERVSETREAATLDTHFLPQAEGGFAIFFLAELDGIRVALKLPCIYHGPKCTVICVTMRHAMGSGFSLKCAEG